ncbi:MAG: hypothetical protein WCJ55_05610 [Chloroflexales bacterium]
MEDRRDQQATPTPQTAPYTPASQLGTTEIQPPSALPAADPYAAGQGIVERITRRLLRRVAYLLILAGRVMRPNLGWVLLTLFLVGVIGMETIALIAPLVVAKLVDNRPPAIPTSAAVESFLQGQARYDAETMWEAFSPQFQAALIDQGISKDHLTAQVRSEREGGQRYTKFSYVGGVALQGEQTMYFYAVDIESSQAAGRNGTYAFIFTVDKRGKIVGMRM